MPRKSSYFVGAIVGIALNEGIVPGQMTMAGMTAMENSVGYLSSGTSVEPKTNAAFGMLRRTVSIRSV
jgi:hypothetical protein